MNRLPSSDQVESSWMFRGWKSGSRRKKIPLKVATGRHRAIANRRNGFAAPFRSTSHRRCALCQTSSRLHQKSPRLSYRLSYSHFSPSPSKTAYSRSPQFLPLPPQNLRIFLGNSLLPIGVIEVPEASSPRFACNLHLTPDLLKTGLRRASSMNYNNLSLQPQQSYRVNHWDPDLFFSQISRQYRINSLTVCLYFHLRSLIIYSARLSQCNSPLPVELLRSLKFTSESRRSRH